ncbi:MAG: transketolase [Planctomycetota bacterium]|jgi:transketolase|nr:transketolase [Planctomycetota bacterium]
MEANKLKELEGIARGIRIDSLESLYHGGSGHPGSALSVADIVTILFFSEMNIDPANPGLPDRDRFILSKGHACPAYYSALARRGFLDRGLLSTLRKIDSPLQGHPVLGKVPGVDMSSGSLGQGLSIAGGMALYAKRRNRPFRVYCVLGDGECQEGQVWEAAMSAGHFGLDNLVAILDANGLQIDGPVAEVMDVQPMSDKFRAFKWKAIEVDGHDFASLDEGLRRAREHKGGPAFLHARTVKGKGVSFMENRVEWHGGQVTGEVYERAMAELGVVQK